MSNLRRLVVLALALAGLIVAMPPESRAEDALPKDVGTWGFSGLLGTGGAGGDYGNLFTKPISGEFDFFRQKGAWRYGIGVSFGSFKMKEPYQDELEWGFQQFYLTGTRLFRPGTSVRPYLQVRAGLARLHPRSFLFAPDPLPEDLEPGDSPTKPANGFSVGVTPGIEWRLSRAAWLDTSFNWTYFSTDEYDLSPVNQPPRGSGTAWQGRFGVTWFPNGGQTAEGPESGERDAWGVRKSWGWAAGETLAINNGAGLINEYVRNANFNQISPRSWWHNLEEGFTYDDNEFKTNQYVHPFNGAAYFNSGRANGLGFWESSIFGMAGAFYWECCGETHPMSINDLASTGIGGIALGETQFRLSSEILDNQATGKGRFWRELGAFLVDPVRGFNRLVSGRAKRQQDNPTDDLDWRPKGSRTLVALGARVIGEGSSITENTNTYGTLLLDHTHGNVFDNDRRKPFDYMEFVGEMFSGEKTRLGNVQIRGDLASWALGDKTSPNNVFAIVQYFDYMNNTAYEFGGQSFGASLMSRFRLSGKTALQTRVDGMGMLLGAVNADYSFLADVADPERLREYDYGPGLGVAGRVYLSVSGRPILGAAYRFNWLSVKNGSVYNEGHIGSDANHYVQLGGLRLVVPIKGAFGLGADAYVFFRNSHYVLMDSSTGEVRRKDVSQRNPQVRVYLALNSGS